MNDRNDVTDADSGEDGNAVAAPATGALRVNGATLHYEVRGEGPLLLLIPGGTGGAASLAGIAGDLATEYTVVTYDPRGIARSTLDDPGAAQRVAEHADDAFRLLDLLSPGGTGGTVRVFGASSGAVTALHLLTTHPDRIARVIAHEPPVAEVLPDAGAHRALLARVRETLHTRGLMPAMAEFAAGLRAPGGAPEPAAPAPLPPQAAARAERTMAGLPYFLDAIVPVFMAYTPDVPRLKSLPDRLVLAAGRESAGEVPHRSAATLAESLGTELVHFPGGHIGSTTHPAEFGALLRETFRA